MLNVKIITAYPEMFPGVLGYSIIGKALLEKKWKLEVVNLHDFGFDDRGSIDDSPFGGGPGMILRADVVEKAMIFATKNMKKDYKLIYLSPSGTPLKQEYLKKISKISEIVILCGKFEGVDYRAIEVLGFHEVSIGDYILSGGEVAAQVLLEGCIRMLPGVLGQPESILEESFSNNLLEHPQYTRPKVWVDVQKNKHNVPDVLLSGHHGKVEDWKKENSFKRTKKNRPDLVKKKKED